jgi:hypothetical protein
VVRNYSAHPISLAAGSGYARQVHPDLDRVERNRDGVVIGALDQTQFDQAGIA